MAVSKSDRQKTVEYATWMLQQQTEGSVSDRIEHGIAEIRDLVGEFLEKDSAGHVSPVLARAHKHFLEQGIDEALATQLIQAVHVDHAIDDEALIILLTEELLRLLPRAVLPPRRDATYPTIIALVGPTGVGKTTTIAKMATKYKLQQGRSVVLVTADTYRIAAVDQLLEYADLFDAKLEIAGTAIQMRETIAKIDDIDIVLIDTAGRSAIDGDRIQETADILEAAGPTEIHLVLSAATSRTATKRAAESFAVTGYDRIIVTKLDEAATVGQIVSTLCTLGKPLSWFTDGQDIDSHIDMARASSLIKRLFKGKNDQ